MSARRGGYSSGSRTVSELPAPPESVCVRPVPSQRMTMGEFRELTADVPDEWPLTYVVREAGDEFRFYPADASVDLTGRTVEIFDA